jgi:hypothetical protein
MVKQGLFKQLFKQGRSLLRLFSNQSDLKRMQEIIELKKR